MAHVPQVDIVIRLGQWIAGILLPVFLVFGFVLVKAIALSAGAIVDGFTGDASMWGGFARVLIGTLLTLGLCWGAIWWVRTQGFNILRFE